MDRTESRFIPSSYSRIVARELCLQEKALPKLLRGTGLSTRILLPGDESALTNEQQLLVLTNARRLSGSPDLGLRLGQRLQPSTHGPLGFLASSSPDLITALRSLQDYLPTRIPFAQLAVQESERWLDCQLEISLKAEAGEIRLLLECFAMLVQAVIEALLERELDDGLFDFSFFKPSYHSNYANYIHGKYRFSRNQNRIRLPGPLAAARNNVADTEVYAMAERVCRQLSETAPATSLSTSGYVRRRLLSNPAAAISESEVARAMFVSKRTLARRLEREGSSFRRIREELLAELAARHLREGGLSVEATAALLGYHDASNFRRAFRRWHGLCPSEFRRRA